MIVEIQRTPKPKYLFLFTALPGTYNRGQEIDDRRKKRNILSLGS